MMEKSQVAYSRATGRNTPWATGRSRISNLTKVRLGAVWPMENRIGSSLNHIQGWTTVREFYSCALEQGPLLSRKFTLNGVLTEQ